MSRQLIYLAHPVAPTAEEIADHDHPTPVDAAINRNLQNALRWLAWLRASFPETTFIAPWIATIESLGGDDSPALREAGLVDDCTVVERCDGIALVGGRISSGMRREMEAGTFGMGWIIDLTGLGAAPPARSIGVTFAAFVDSYRYGSRQVAP